MNEYLRGFVLSLDVQGETLVIDMFGMQSPEIDLELSRTSFNAILL